jgi:hypothetical protein
MKYQAPYGSDDPDAPYVDRSTPNATQGSKVPRKAIEHPQREIVAVIESAGLTPSGTDTTQLLQALQYFFGQFPIYPECLNSNGTFDVVTPSTGVVRIPAGINWVIRGATRYATTAVINLNTIASKVYHLRWDKAHGFRLRDLADAAYNPTSAAEDNAAFDSAYDDMLIAKVTTGAGNAVTIVNLKNRSRITDKIIWRGAVTQALSLTALSGTSITYNWARTPDIADISLKGFRSNQTDADGDPTPVIAGKVLSAEVQIPPAGANRYGIGNINYLYEDDAGNQGFLSFYVRVISP